MVELKELDAGWLPWRWQVNRYVEDGKAYGRPGQRIRVSMANFETKAEAETAFGDLERIENR